MNKLKKFYENHKTEIIVTGCVIGGAILGGVLTKRQIGKDFMLISKENSAIWWKPTRKGFMNLETAKEILDLNAGNNETLAIVKDGQLGKDIYNVVLLSKDVVTEKLV